MDYPVKKNWYNQRLYDRQVDGVVAISKKIADLLVGAGVRTEKIRVIHSGINPKSFQKERAMQAPTQPVIGTVAVLEERKGHRFLIEAALLLKKRGYKLQYHFAGEGSRRRYLERLVSQLGLRDDAMFMGFVHDVPAFLAEVDCVVLPSLYEGLGVAVLEAMAAGRPVVASRVGGIPELVEDQVTGLLVPPGDPMALADAVSHLVSDKGLMERMGSKAREYVEQHFTVEQMAKKNEGFYYELLREESDRILTGVSN
jgi:glycosyltransferase involved in cell wall biosynthesis